MQYLLGLSSPAECEKIESEYFDNKSAFEEMLTAENDLIDAYARGALTDEERRRFEKRFLCSSSGRDRVEFARAFAGIVSATRPVEPKLPGPFFNTFQLPGLLRTATLVAAVVFIIVLAWLIADRRRMTNELRELQGEFAELSKRSEALQRSSDRERTRTTEIAAELADLRSTPSRGNVFEPRKINKPPLNASDVPNLLTLEPTKTREGNVADGRADQSNITLDGVDLKAVDTEFFRVVNTSISGTTTIRGIVRDPQGNLVNGATVTLTDPAGSFIRTHSTNEDGAYVLNAVPPGSYSLKIQVPGYKSAVILDLAALVNTSTVVDVMLELGAVSETVTSAAGEVLVNRDDGTLGNSFAIKPITQLPLQGVNATNLLSLQPNATRTEADQSNITLDRKNSTIRIPNSISWIRFQIASNKAAFHEDYRVTIKTAGGRPVTSEDWREPLTPNQTIIDTPTIPANDLPSGDYVLLLLGKKPGGSFVKVAEYSFKIIKY